MVDFDPNQGRRENRGEAKHSVAHASTRHVLTLPARNPKRSKAERARG